MAQRGDIDLPKDKAKRSVADYGPPFGNVSEPEAPYRKIRAEDKQRAKSRKRSRGKRR